MKYLNDDRAPSASQKLLEQVREAATRAWRVLEGVGGQVHKALRHDEGGAPQAGVDFLHGPGCPACALPVGMIDLAVGLAETPGVIFCAPGRLLRIPGSGAASDLESARSRGADVRTVYSALDALAIARKSPGRAVVFLAAGFETTAPTSAAAVLEADRLGLDGFSVLNGHLRATAGLAASARATNAEAVLAPGLVATVTGLDEFASLSDLEGVPVVVTGPEPLDFLEGTLMAVRQLEEGRASAENQYVRAVRPGGGAQAIAAISAVFEPSQAEWRGLGRVAEGGMALRDRFRRFDAASRFSLRPIPAKEEATGRPCGDVVAGLARPEDCPSFGGRCTPERPLGAPMVSVEGTCFACHRHRRPGVAASPAHVPSAALAHRRGGA